MHNQEGTITTIKEIVERLNDNPSEANWKRFASEIKRSGARYYRMFYPAGRSGKSSIREAYAVLYDGRRRSLFRVPACKKSGSAVEDATEYLKGLTPNKEEGKTEPGQDEARTQMMRKLKELGYA
jgi:hypothetical protein